MPCDQHTRKRGKLMELKHNQERKKITIFSHHFHLHQLPLRRLGYFCPDLHHHKILMSRQALQLHHYPCLMLPELPKVALQVKKPRWNLNSFLLPVVSDGYDCLYILSLLSVHLLISQPFSLWGSPGKCTCSNSLDFHLL